MLIDEDVIYPTLVLYLHLVLTDLMSLRVHA